MGKAVNESTFWEFATLSLFVGVLFGLAIGLALMQAKEAVEARARAAAPKVERMPGSQWRPSGR